MKINLKYENNNHLLIAIHNLVQMTFIYYFFNKLLSIEEDFGKYMYHFGINGKRNDDYAINECFLSEIRLSEELNYKWVVSFVSEISPCIKIRKILQMKNDFYLHTCTDSIRIQNDRIQLSL